MKTYPPIILSCFCLLAAQLLMAQPSVYSLPFENPVRIPARETRIDLEELSATYQTLENMYTTEITGIGDETMEQTSKTQVFDVKAVDAVRFLEFYMEDQLLDPATLASGLMEMSVVYFNGDTRMNAGTILGVLTFGIATLLGVPHSTAVVDVEVRASFYDTRQILVASHRGVGRGLSIQTLYSSAGMRRAHQKALKKALGDLNDKILLDPVIAGTPQQGTP